ncbi:long-chain fatty acid--CoA ligase, partial [Streptomyces decoyicus]
MTDTHTLIENRPPSVAHLFLERVAATPDIEAYRYPVPPSKLSASREQGGAPAGQGADDWKVLSWAQAAERVYAVAAGLIALGILPEERVALAAN